MTIFSQAKSPELSRRLVSIYLLFGMLSIVFVAMGMAALMYSSSKTTLETSLLAQLVDRSMELTKLLADEQADQLQTTVASLAQDGDLLYCAVVDNDGTIRAHSTPNLIGKRSPANFSASLSPGIVERVSYLREDQAGPKEYWLPLRTSERSLGMLQVAIAGEPTSNFFIALLEQNAGMALAIPMLLLFAGGSRLRGVISTSSAIGRQLSRLAEDDQAPLDSLQPVEEDDQESAGWNKLIAKAGQAESFKSLESHLSQVLGGVKEQKYAQILQSLTDGIAVTGEQGQITFANEAFARMLGKKASDVPGQSVEQLIPSGRPENVIDFQEKLQSSARAGVVELWRSAEMSDGILRLARAPLPSADGLTQSQLWSLRDITQQKLIEHTRDQFVDTATHELRTPLSTIRACAEALELYDDIDVETQKHYVNTINNESTRLGRFVDEFLNISRMEAGSLALNRHNTHMEKLLSEVVDKIRPAMQLKQIDFNAALPPKLPELKIDKDKISAALLNLLGNAEKYTPTGGEVRLLAELNDEELRIHVEDSGFGISPEELTKVFSKFFRSDDARVREITGTGLGLSFSQEVVRLHGGSLSATSELNHGSRFTMTLPLRGAE